MSAFLYYLASLSCGGIAIVSLREKWRSNAAWPVSIAAFLTSIAYAIRGSQFVLHDTLWMLIYPLCGILIPSALAEFVQKWLNIRSQKRIIQHFSILLFFLSLILIYFGFYDSIFILSATWLFIGCSYVSYMIYSLWKKEVEPIRQTRLLYLVGFLLSALLATLFEGLGRVLHNPTAEGFYQFDVQGPVPPIGALLTTLLFFCLWLNLRLTRLVGLDEFFTRLISLLIPAILLGGLMTSAVWLGSGNISHALFQTSLISGLFLAFYPSFQEPITEMANGVFNRKGQKLIRALKNMSRTIPQLVTIDDVDQIILAPLYESGRVAYATLYLWKHEEGVFGLHSTQGEWQNKTPPIFGQEPFAGMLQIGKHLHVDPLLLQAKKQDNHNAQRALRSLEQQHIEAAHPIWVDDMLAGWIGLQSDMVSGGFSQKELRRVQHLIDQAAIQLETIRSIEYSKEQHRLAVLGTMSAGLAHEIRNPLAGIKGAVQYLQDGAEPDEIEDFYQLIETETERLNTILIQFLDYARPLKRQLHPVHINDLLMRSQTLFQSSSPDVEWSMTLSEDLTSIKGDPTQIQQVFINLIQNSIQAMSTKGTIKIMTKLDRCYEPPNQGQPAVLVKIEDNGPGFSQKARSQIFTPFFTTKQNGVGLGLAISHRIIESHGGEVQLTHTPKGGATFIIRFPILT